MRKLLLVLIAAAALVVASGLSRTLRAQGQSRPAPDVYGQLRWRYIGPEGNRTDAVAGVPGDPLNRSHIAVGEGICRSTDAGQTWTRMGLEKTGRIARVAVHPTDPNVVL